MKPWNPINNKTRWFTDNFRQALDAPGEWFLERSGTLYYIPCEGETIENTSFTAPLLNKFITINGDEAAGKMVENSSFENIVFEFSGSRMPYNGNEPAQAAFSVGAVMTLDFAKNITFSNCELAHTGTYGFLFRRACSNCSVTGCYLHDLGAGGIKIGETTIDQDAKNITRKIIIDKMSIGNQ